MNQQLNKVVPEGHLNIIIHAHVSQVFQEVRKVTRLHISKLNDRTKISDFNKFLLKVFKTSDTFTLFLKSLRFKHISSVTSRLNQSINHGVRGEVHTNMGWTGVMSEASTVSSFLGPDPFDASC